MNKFIRKLEIFKLKNKSLLPKNISPSFIIPMTISEPKIINSILANSAPSKIEQIILENPGIVSFSLYGSDDFYNIGALENARLMKTIYPNWTMRVYCDSQCTVRKELEAYGCNIYNGLKDIPQTCWRFLAASDSKVDRIIFRDDKGIILIFDRYSIFFENSSFLRRHCHYIWSYSILLTKGCKQIQIGFISAIAKDKQVFFWYGHFGNSLKELF